MGVAVIMEIADIKLIVVIIVINFIGVIKSMDKFSCSHNALHCNVAHLRWSICLA